ncbi:hypothetical protein QUF63_01895 [Anaerolineales bacterium HSG25]|nr:hypothetical protein [Anaerolineales bacterium HSG25]
MSFPIEKIDVSQLDVVSQTLDIRRDMHAFVDYVANRSVKRTHRDNSLSKPDSKRLAKLMGDPRGLEQIQQNGYARWVDLVDSTALKLGLVKYDTEGSYAGYSSSEPTFSNNFVEIDEVACEDFYNSSLMEQERKILKSLIKDCDHCENEFFYWRWLDERTTPFTRSGCATGVLPMLDFAEIRRFIFKLLAQGEAGVWYSTASLVAYLKKKHPYFLIPKSPKMKHARRDPNRYQNFYRNSNTWDKKNWIYDTDKDAFEQVEGRYIERFLERLPFILKYVDIAYEPKTEVMGSSFTITHRGREDEPTINLVQGFRVNQLYLDYMHDKFAGPKVIVQPNFEIHIDSPIYPANTLSKLYPLTDIVAEDKITILRLNRQKVAAQLADDAYPYSESAELLAYLTELSDRPLPQNIVMEIEEWGSEVDNFILYDGFAILETPRKRLKQVDPYLEAKISPTLSIIKEPTQLYNVLEKAELLPLRISHTETTLTPIPDKAKTVFPKRKKERPKPKQKETLTLMRHTTITLHFPNQTALKVFRKALLDARCPIETDMSQLILTYNKQYEKQVNEVFKELRKSYKLTITDVTGGVK